MNIDTDDTSDGDDDMFSNEEDDPSVCSADTCWNDDNMTPWSEHGHREEPPLTQTGD